MENTAIFRGVLTAIRPLKTSGDVQFIVTVPAHEANEALKLAGGFIDPKESRWVAVARIEVAQTTTALRPASTNGDADNATASKREDADT